MRTVYDQLAKRMLERALKNGATIRAPFEVSAEAQTIDVFVQPALDSAALRLPLGLLGRITNQTCLLEPFHKAPDAIQIRNCVLKMLAFDAKERREKRANATHELVVAPLWILAAGTPNKAISSLGFVQATGWPAGVYGLAPEWSTWLVAINELPVSRATILLRLMGAGAVLARAIGELRTLPREAAEVQIALPVLEELRLALSTQPGQTEEERNLAMELERTYEQIISEAISKGERNAQTHLLSLQLAKRLGRVLDSSEQTRLQAKIARFGADSVAELVMERDSEALLVWLHASDVS